MILSFVLGLSFGKLNRIESLEVLYEEYKEVSEAKLKKMKSLHEEYKKLSNEAYQKMNLAHKEYEQRLIEIIKQ